MGSSRRELFWELSFMPPMHRRRRALSYGEHVAKTGNLRKVMSLVSPLLECNGDPAVAAPAARALREQAPRVSGQRVPLDADPWTWLCDTSVDGHTLGEYSSAARIALAADIWQWLLDQDDRLAAVTGLVRPTPDVVATMYGIGLDCVSRLDRQFPLSVTQYAIYMVDDVAQRFAAGLVELYSRGYPIDPGTYAFARSIHRPAPGGPR